MTRINELRLGNKLMYDKRVVDVMGISKSGRIFSGADGYVQGNDLHPILLDRDWLLDFGFKETGMGIYRHRQLTEIFSTFNEYFFRYDGKIIASCKYVHELQNIFFSLYKEEIKLKVLTHSNLNKSGSIFGESFLVEKKTEIQIL